MITVDHIEHYLAALYIRNQRLQRFFYYQIDPDRGCKMINHIAFLDQFIH